MKHTLFLITASTLIWGCKDAPKAPNLARDSDDGKPRVIVGNGDDEKELDEIENEIKEAGIVATDKALNLKELVDEPAFAPLSHSQLENALHVVFEVPAAERLIEANLPPFASSTLFDNDSTQMTLNYDFMQPYAQVASGLVDKLVTKSNKFQAVIPANAPKASGLDRARAIVGPLLKKAYQGQETEQDITALATAFVAASTAYPQDGFDKAGMRAIIPAIIFSPKFLYRSQAGDDAGDSRALNGQELISRLAGSLWNTIPNSELLAEASAIDGDDSKALDTLVTTMIRDNRFDEQITRFNIFALRANSLHAIDRSDDHWTPKNKDLIRQETESFFAHITKENKGLTEILTAPYAFVSEASAPFYGVSSPGAQPVKTDLESTQRRGFYSQVGFLAFNADALGNQTIRRGASVVKSLVCTNALNGERAEPMPVKNDVKMTTRQAVSQGTDGCGQLCHKPLMNPIGFAFEVFNKNGQWQDKDNGFAVNAADVLYLSQERKIDFDGAAEFSEKLATMFETHRCYASKVVQYVFGRNPSLAEKDLIDLLASASLKGASTKDLFVKAVGSSAYRHRAAQ